MGFNNMAEAENTETLKVQYVQFSSISWGKCVLHLIKVNPWLDFSSHRGWNAERKTETIGSLVLDYCRV